ncbi:MAG: hypothetical protein SOU51_02785 [Collinsella sp.]|nr:hypothetical protein [Collinsella sp.]
MGKRDSNIDPFNAGEPILPWQDPDSELRDDEPGERPSYEAPKRAASQDSRRRANNPDDTRKRIKSASFVTRPKTKKHPFAKIITVIVVFIVTTGLFGLHREVASKRFITSFTGFDDTVADEELDISELDEDESECLGITMSRIELMMTPGTDEHAEAVGIISETLEGQIRQNHNLSLDQLGIDRTAFAERCMESLVFSPDSAFAFPDDPEPYGAVYLDATAIDTLMLSIDFCEELEGYFEDEGISPFQGDVSLTPEQKAHVSNLLLEMADDADTFTSFARIQLHVTADGWAIDEGEYEETLRHTFQAYRII